MDEDLRAMIEAEKKEIIKESENSMREIEELKNSASAILSEQVKRGDKNIIDATIEATKAGAMARAAQENVDSYAKRGDKIMTTEFDTDETKSRERLRHAKNADNERFYETFRPILEFDFEFITGQKKRQENATEKTKSFSKGAMIVTIAFAIVPWLIIALCLYLFKGINSIVVMVSEFTKSAKGIILASCIILGIYIILVIIDHYLQAYAGISIFPTIKDRIESI